MGVKGSAMLRNWVEPRVRGVKSIWGSEKSASVARMHPVRRPGEPERGPQGWFYAERMP
jgi:hypothetical protein